MLDIEAYLDRINYKGHLKADLETLRGLHLAHMYAVPFENLNIHYNLPISLDTNALTDKIIRKRRGGYCYELNGLFAQLLQAIGFDVTFLSAQMARDAGGFGPEFDHLTLLVKLEQSWLADVGSGDSLLFPLLWQPENVQRVGDDFFEFRLESGRLLLMRRRPAQDWKPLYSVSIVPRKFEEFFEMSRFHAVSADSPFRKHIIARLDRPDGRLALLDKKLKVVSFSSEDSDLEYEGAAFLEMLKDYFGIVLHVPEMNGQER